MKDEAPAQLAFIQVDRAATGDPAHDADAMGAAVTAVSPASFGAPGVRAETPGHDGHADTTTAVPPASETNAWLYVFGW